MKITINYKGVDFDVEYDYQPHENMIEQINEFRHKGTCFLEWIKYDKYEVEELILEKMHEY